MGTRADFYVKTGDELEWLGSIGWDGYPDGIDEPVLRAATEADFRNEVANFFAPRNDVTRPERGWPWPWNTSDTTDYAYVFADGFGVVHKCFGGEIVRSLDVLRGDDEPAPVTGISYEHPDMSARQNTRFDAAGSGLLIIGRR